MVFGPALVWKVTSPCSPPTSRRRTSGLRQKTCTRLAAFGWSLPRSRCSSLAHRAAAAAGAVAVAVADPLADVLPAAPLVDGGLPLGEDGPPVEADAPPVSATPMPAPLPSRTAPTATEVTTRLVRPDQRRAGAGVLAGSIGSN